MGDIEVVTASEAQWPALAELFGRGGASNGCWCQYWLLGADYHRHDRELNQRDLRVQVDDRRAGLLARRDGRTVGWARVTPHSALPHLIGRFRLSESGQDPLALPCFFVRRADRETGVMRALIEGAQQQARSLDLPVEGYPVDPTAIGAPRNRFAGVLSAFIDAGFVVVARLAADRARVRWTP